jgi:hypothetical protein
MFDVKIFSREKSHNKKDGFLWDSDIIRVTTSIIYMMEVEHARLLLPQVFKYVHHTVYVPVDYELYHSWLLVV